MTHLCIDASTKSSGYSIFKDGKMIESGLIRPTEKTPMERMPTIKKCFEDIFSKHKIDKVFIEDVPLAQSINKRVAEYLLLLQGIILGLSIDNSCEFKQLPPSNWRKLAEVKAKDRKRDSQKEAAINLVNELYGTSYKWVDKKYDEETGDSDICEAILIGIASLKI